MVALEHIRLVEVPHDVDFPVHVVMPPGRTSVALTAAISILPEECSPKYAQRQIGAALHFLDWWSGRPDGGREDEPKLSMIGAYKEYLRTLGCRVTKLQNTQHFTVVTPADKVSQVKATCIGLSNLYRIMCENGYREDSHPFELSEDELRRQRQRLSEVDRKNSLKRRIAATATLFRVQADEYRPPRRTLVQLVADAPEKARAAGWPLSLQLYLQLLYEGGPRPSEPAEMTMLDWYEASGFGTAIAAISKGSNGRRVKTVRFSGELAAALRDYVDGPRRDIVPGAPTLQQLKAFGDAGKHAQLADERLFVNSRGDPWQYEAIRRYYWNPTIRDTSIDPATGLPPLILPTMHWLRHLYVYSFLTRIELSEQTEAQKHRSKENLRSYIGWSKDSNMLAIYGREFDEQLIAEEVYEHIQRRESAMRSIAAGTFTAPIPDAAPKRSERQRKLFRSRG